jgi:hypothetical protein
MKLSLSRTLVIAFSTAGLGCSSEPGPFQQPTGGQAGAPNAAGGVTSAGTSAGGSAANSSSSAGGPAGGQAGETVGAGGVAGLGGAAGGPGDESAAAQVLSGYLLEKPCVDGYVPVPNVNQTCPESPETETQHRTEHFGGDASVTYLVTLRVRGVNERHWYEGGSLDTNQRVYVGGRPTAHSPLAPDADFTPGQGACPMHPPETDEKFKLPFELPTEIRPSDGCFNAYTIFALIVSAPKQTYYLNYTDDFDGKDRPAHVVHATDYSITVSIQGQAALDFFVVDGDHHQVTNDGSVSVEGLKVAQPYNGTVLQLDVLSVTRAP